MQEQHIGKRPVAPIVLYTLCLLLLSACTGGAVVFAPTPLPPELAPTQYQHPSGAFTVLVPGTWSLYEQQNALYAAASFSPPNSDTPLVQMSVLNLPNTIDTDTVGELMTQYQSQFRPDAPRYTEQSREAMGDGSWRLTGLRTAPSGEPQQVNTFVQWRGNLLGIINVTLPADAALRSQIQSLVNTFTLAESSSLPVSALATLTSAGQSQLEIINLNTWSSTEGVFYVTGEVTNHSTEAITEIPIRATLLSNTGAVVADSSSMVMGYAVESGGFAPFGIRFGEGQPLPATQYRVILGGDDFVPQTTTVIGSPTLRWTDSTEFTPDGDLFILGNVENASASDVRAPRAIATVFDEQGRVIGTGFTDIQNNLDAGESADFSILLSDLGGTPANYVVNVQALP